MASHTVHKRTEVSWEKAGGCCYSWIYAYALQLYECNVLSTYLCLPLYILCACHCTYVSVSTHAFRWIDGGPFLLLFCFLVLGQGVCFLVWRTENSDNVWDFCLYWLYLHFNLRKTCVRLSGEVIL